MKFCICIFSLFVSLLMLPGHSVAEGKNIIINVSKNDSLIEICRKYLKKPEMWSRIAKYNQLVNPDRLSPGQKIIIPFDMLKSSPMDGRVTSIQGKAALKDGLSAWNTLKLNDVVRIGSSLKTGADSQIEVSFEDGTSFAMRENTVLKVKAAEKGVLHILRVLYVETGKVVSRVKAATGRDSRFEVETPSALAAARGTEYRVGVDDLNTTRAEMLESSIVLTATGKTVELKEGEGAVARKGEAPSLPVKLLMPPKMVLAKHDDNNMLEFSFAKIELASGYRVFLSSDRDGKSIIKSDLIKPDKSFKIEKPANGKYFLVASSIDVNGLEGPLSKPEEVIVQEKVLPPVLVVPSENAKLLDAPISIQWQSVSGAAHYHLQVSADSGFTKIITEENGIKIAGFRLKKLDSGQYYLRIRSVSDDGVSGVWSAARRIFVTEPPVPEIHKLSASNKQVEFEWAAIPEAVSYLVQIAADADFREIVLNEKTGQHRVLPDKELQPGKYYVRVCGINSENNAGSFSKAAIFEIENSKNYTLEIIGTAGLVLLLLLL